MNYKVTVIDNESYGSNAALMRLKAPAWAGRAKPGQFMMLRPSPGPDPLLARPFSIFFAQGEEIQILYQVVGRGTRLLYQARPGDSLTAWGPLGRGFSLQAKRPLLVGGGMGLAPLAFAAQVLRSAGSDPLVCWGLPTAGSLAAILDSSGNSGPDLTEALLATEDGSQGRQGLVTSLLAEHLDECDQVLTCGPLPMLKAVAVMCARAGKPCQVSLEAPMACGVGACLGCVLPRREGGYMRVCQEGPVVEGDRLDWDAV